MNTYGMLDSMMHRQACKESLKQLEHELLEYIARTVLYDIDYTLCDYPQFNVVHDILKIIRDKIKVLEEDELTK